ncbi:MULTISPECIES: hypothetical protein [Streptomyces]|uniref:hypothetical protein n=1 Tax=Streptomyces TaxID=1883 RepID=UPI0016773015|nr:MULTISPECIES: hypothetical protein [Streptomyces]MBK3525815.1 hypothetical protein [Streptomyces sp. MBT70]GGS01700.1 hypothetical protein GCM10010236_65500 [Streptomyces eurythermus]
MLARLPLPWLFLFAAFATAVLGAGIQWAFRSPKAVVVYLAISAGCCLGMVAAGARQYQHWTISQMLVLYSFSWLGLAIGFFPSRKLLRRYAEDHRRGGSPESITFPARYQAPVYISVSLMVLLAFILSA